MQTILRKMGNSTGIIVPKAMLGELGIATGQAIRLRLENGRIVATPIHAGKREGWASAAQAIGESGESADMEAADWGGFGNVDDDALTW